MTPVAAGLQRVPPVVAAAACAAVAALAVALAQPVRAPWWLYADSDAPYVASSFKLATHQPTEYFDHPGLPLQELFAYVFEARRLVDGGPSPASYERVQLRDLGRWAPWWRTFGVVFWVTAAAVFAIVVSRILGGVWGVFAALLWLGAPGLAPMAIQYRADVPLAAACAGFGLFLVRAAERRHTGLFCAAAATAGFATTLKANAAGLLVPLVLGLVLRPPAEGWGRCAARSAAAWARAHWLAVLIAVDVLAALVWWFNRGLLPPATTSEEQHLLVVAAAAIGVYALLVVAGRRVLGARRLLQPAIAGAAVAFCGGVLAPVVLFPSYGLAMLVRIEQTWTGGGVNSGIDLFAFPHDEFLHRPLQQTAVVFVLAAVAAVVGARRLDYGPLLLFVGAAVMLVLALARLGSTYYFVPTFVLAVPAALWLLARAHRRVGMVVAAALTLYVVVPQVIEVREPAHRAAAQERLAAGLRSYAAALLAPGDAALVDQEAPSADSRYNGMVQNFVDDVPQPPQARFFDDFWRTNDWLAIQHQQLRYYFGRRALEVTRPGELEFQVGRFWVVPLPRYARHDLGIGVLRLVRRLSAPA
jgi:hypothetical protein